MDTEHHVENSELTEPSQIISALIFNGDTYPIAQDAYNALADLVHVKLQKLIDGIAEFKDVKDKTKLYNEVTKFLVKTFEKKEQQSIAAFVASLAKKDMTNSARALPMIKEEIDNEALANLAEEEGESGLMDSFIEKGSKMPFSTYIYSTFVTMLSNNLNKSAIKRKLPGLASVMKPSGGIVQLYVVKTETGERVVTSDVFHTKYKGVVQMEDTLGKEVSLFDWVANPEGIEIHLDTPFKLVEFKKKYNDVNIKLIYGKPRELKPVEVKFTVPDLKDRSMSIYETEDFSLVMAFLRLSKEKVTFNELVKTGELDAAKLLEMMAPYYTNLTINNLKDPLFFAANKKKISQILKNNTQNVLREIEQNKRIKFGGVWHNVSNVEVLPGEAMGPNMYRNDFSLPIGISKDDITVEYLKERLDKNSLPQTTKADYYIRNANGNHIYVFVKNTKNFNENVTRFAPTEQIIKEIDGEKWVVDEFGDKEFKVDGVTLSSFISENGQKLKAIIVDNISTDINVVLQPVTEFIDNLEGDLRENALTLNDEISINKLLSTNQRLSEQMYSSFQLANEFTSARIPGQGAQSFTPLVIVDFIHTESNTIMTNHFTTWLKGEDYDIDKGFWLGVTNKNGKFAGWSKFFDYSTPAQLKLSTLLPMPNGSYKVLDPDNSEFTLTRAEMDSFTTPGLNRTMVDALNKLSRIKTYDFDESVTEEEKVTISKTIDSFFSEVLTERRLESAVKNKVSRSVFSMISALVNQVHAESPISLSETQEAAKSSSSEEISALNPATIAKLQDANMVGKDVIGIAAVGLKVWSALSYWGNSKVLSGDFEDIFINKNVFINGKEYTFPTIANLNFRNQVLQEISDETVASMMTQNGMNPADKELAVKYKEGLIAKREGLMLAEFNDFVTQRLTTEGAKNVEEIVSDTAARFLLNADQSLVLSALLSAATDNAKELVLAKINAGPATAGVYAYLTMLGVPFTEIADMMISKDVKWIVKHSRTNVFNKKTLGKNIKNATKSWLEGPSLFRSISSPEKLFPIETWYRNILSNNLTLNEKQKALLSFQKGKPPIRVVNIGGLTELIMAGDNVSTKTPESIQAEIQKILKLFSSNIPATLPRSSQGKMSPEEAEMMEEMMENSPEYNGPRELNVKDDILNILEELDEYIEEVGVPTKARIKNIKGFQQIYNDSQELTIMGRIFGINQGIKTNAYYQYAFYQNVDDFVNTKIDETIADLVDINGNKITTDEEGKSTNKYGTVFKAMATGELEGSMSRRVFIVNMIADSMGLTLPEAEKLFNECIGRFSFKNFLSFDAQKKDVVKLAYGNMKSTFNIFDIIDSVPHFKAMLEVPGIMEDIKTSLSVKSRAVEDMIGQIFEQGLIAKVMEKSESGEIVREAKPKISEKNYIRISDFCNDILILKWMMGLPESQRKFSYKARGEYRFEGIDMVHEDFSPTAKNLSGLEKVTIDLGKIEGRANFIDMFHDMIIQLKRDEKYKDNVFIQGLRIDWKADYLTGEEYQFYKLPINILSVNDYNRGAFNSFVMAFNDLESDVHTDSGMRLKDLFFVYDTLVHKGKVNRESLAKLFEYDNNYSTESLLYDFINKIGQMDYNNETLTELQDAGENANYVIDDLIIKGFAERVFTFNLSDFKGKYGYAILVGDNDEVYTQYYIWNPVAKSYEKYQHFMNAMAMPYASNSPISLAKNTEIKTNLIEAIKNNLVSLKDVKFKIECD